MAKKHIGPYTFAYLQLEKGVPGRVRRKKVKKKYLPISEYMIP